MSDILRTTCQYCNLPCRKEGKQKNGSQKLRCTSCKKYQLESYSNRGSEKNIKEWIVRIYVKNVGIRDVAALLGISVNTVLKEIKKYHYYKPVISYKTNQEYEIDEMRTFVGNKKIRRWIAYAIERSTKRVINVVVGRRTNNTLSKVVNSVLKLSPHKIYTDGLQIYKTLIPHKIHCVKKHSIQIIERTNLTARGKLRRLNRKTIAYSRSEMMLSASIKLLFWKQEHEKVWDISS